MKVRASSYLLSQKDKLKEIIAILAKEFAYVSILGTDVDGKGYLVSTSKSAIEPSMDQERGFVLRVFQNTGISEYSFNDVDVDRVVSRVREIAKKDRERFAQKGVLPYATAPSDEPAELFYLGEAQNLPEDDDDGAILARLQKAHDANMGTRKEVPYLQLALSVTQVNKLFLSLHRDLYQSYVYANATIVALASDGEKRKSEYKGLSLLGGSELLDEMEAPVATVCDHAVELLGAERVEAGEYDILCDPDFTGLIAHEAFGHGTEMDMFVKHRAKGEEYLNKRVASDVLVMHDGASAIDEVSSYAFDDEGNFAQDTVIIDHGFFKNGMCDALSALQLGVAPTGNGKRESYKRKAYTRMTNTFFEGGKDTLEDMVASISHGYLLEGLDSGMEDPKNWGIQCVAAKAHEIRDGKLTGKIVSPVYLTGYVPDLLQSISMVSPKVEMSGTGYCGKGWKEWVKTSTGGSYIKARGKLS